MKSMYSGFRKKIKLKTDFFKDAERKTNAWVSMGIRPILRLRRTYDNLPSVPSSPAVTRPYKISEIVSAAGRQSRWSGNRHLQRLSQVRSGALEDQRPALVERSAFAGHP
jgi:hypothetical protein